MPSTISTRKKLFLEALEKNMGIVSIAAEKVNIHRDTHYKWMKSDKKYAAKVDALESRMVDLSQSKMYQAINGYEVTEEKLYFDKDNNPQVISIKKKILPSEKLIQFHLETRGKDRGFVKRTEVTGADGAALNTVEEIDYDKLTDEQLEALLRAVKKKPATEGGE